MRPIDADAIVFDYSGLAYIGPHDYRDIAKYFADQIARQPTLISLPQEQVKELSPGCDFCKKELNDYPFITAIGEYGDSVNSHTPQYCPLCGRPLTPEAWKETRRNLEALKDADTNY